MLFEYKLKIKNKLFEHQEEIISGVGDMQVTLQPKRTKHIEQTSIIHQTAFWSRVKKQQGCNTKAFDILIKEDQGQTNHDRLSSEENNSSPNGSDSDMLVVFRSLGQEAEMAYVPFGPKFLPDIDRRGPWLEQISEELRPHLPETCRFIRFDLPWESPWSKDMNCYSEKNIWLGEPKTRIQEMRMNFDTSQWNLRRAPTDLLPKDTVILDLNLDSDQLLKQMKPKTRYNIRLSDRKGVRVREAGKDELAVWYQLYCQTAYRHGMFLNDLEYFRSVFEVRAKDSNSPGQVHMLLAEFGDVPMAGLLMAISGSRATYLYGASSDKNRGCMASYALQWKAICKAKEAGCKEYDFFGISPNPDPYHPMYGLYRFKTGFGGNIYHYQGCWDYPFDESFYEMYRISEMNGPAFVS